MNLSRFDYRDGDGTVAGILLMSLSAFVLSFNDAIAKLLVRQYPVGEILFLRSIPALIILAPFVWRHGLTRLTQIGRLDLHILRVSLSILDICCFYIALSHLSLVEVITYYLATPLYVAALSPLLLKEAVGWRRWSAVVAGFLGVLVALRPSPALFSWASLIAIGGSLSFALLLITTRRLKGAPNTVLIAFQVVGGFAFGTAAIPFGWTSPGVWDLLLITSLGIFVILGFALMNLSLRLAPASTVVPFQYTLICWSAVFGYLFFGDIPMISTIAGAFLIISAGLYIFFCERRRSGEPRT